MLDLVTMQMKVDLRSRGGREKTREELSRTMYDFPRNYQETNSNNEVELRRR